jgi:hypothetical protein
VIVAAALGGGAALPTLTSDRQLEQYGVEKIISIALLANSCIGSTGRFAR